MIKIPHHMTRTPYRMIKIPHRKIKIPHHMINSIFIVPPRYSWNIVSLFILCIILFTHLSK
jgi:hypothetical protein